ncbi:MAG TPA: hypothetical protein ENJ06_00245 [Phycisphaeraceae bacterium]|nr:hypothetical protein [Phycisphaeraceae bacterium]
MALTDHTRRGKHEKYIIRQDFSAYNFVKRSSGNTENRTEKIAGKPAVKMTLMVGRGDNQEFLPAPR